MQLAAHARCHLQCLLVTTTCEHHHDHARPCTTHLLSMCLMPSCSLMMSALSLSSRAACCLLTHVADIILLFLSASAAIRAWMSAQQQQHDVEALSVAARNCCSQAACVAVAQDDILGSSPQPDQETTLRGIIMNICEDLLAASSLKQAQLNG
jgi:hypothetical protein